MAYSLKKDHLTNWDLHESNEKAIINDDHDSYTSERTSIPSLNGNVPLFSPVEKQLPTPSYMIPKEPHSLRYYYNELPENGIPLATQVKNARKEEAKQKKAIRKASPGQGNLVSLPGAKPSEMGDDYYPYSHYYQV